MHLTPKSQLYGQPARHIRDFMRYFAMGTLDEAHIESTLQVSASEAHIILAGLLHDGYIAQALPKSGIPQFRMTGKGRQLAAASFAKQIPRSKGDEILAGVLARAADVEAQRPFAFRLVKLALFGSMLGDTMVVSDVDLALHAVPVFDGARHYEAGEVRIKVAEEAGTRFRSRLHSIVWPRQELTEYLRGGDRYVRLHSFAELELLGCQFQLIFGD